MKRRSPTKRISIRSSLKGAHPSHSSASSISAPDRIRIHPRLEIVPAVLPTQISAASNLFKEYAASIGISLCFQDFAEEVANLPGEYAAPTGGLFLAEYAGEVVGCVALRRLTHRLCEMKRLYVRPEYRGKQIGRALVERIIDAAHRMKYKAMVLDTLCSMKSAMKLYESIGFQRTKPSRGKPRDGVVYMKFWFKSSSSSSKAPADKSRRKTKS